MKRAKKHGAQEQVFTEPQPTVRFSDDGVVRPDDDEENESEDNESEDDTDTSN